MIKRKILPLFALISLPICFSCTNRYTISFECFHCSYSINKANQYEANFNIDFGWQLNQKDIEVTNNGVLDNECWTFMYQSNIVNSFKIKQEMVKGDIKVKINCTPKSLFEYGLAVDVDSVDQSTIRFYPIQREMKEIKDWQRWAYPIYEDEKLEFTFSAKESETLPNNIGMWMNGRYAREGVEVNFEYSSDNKSCRVTVPYFVTKDNLQFRVK